LVRDNWANWWRAIGDVEGVAVGFVEAVSARHDGCGGGWFQRVECACARVALTRGDVSVL
jgi:hypothetical protein